VITSIKSYFFRDRFPISLALAFALLLLLTGCKDVKTSASFDSYAASGGRLDNIKTVAVVGFPADKAWQSDMKASLSYHLRLSGCVTVMDPGEADALLAAKGISTEGAFTDEKAAEIGEALKVDAVIHGATDTSFLTVVRYKEPELPAYSLFRCRRQLVVYRPAYSIPYLHREGRVSVTLRLYDTHIHKSAGTVQAETGYFNDFNTFFSHSVKYAPPFYFDRAYHSEMPSDSQMKFMMADRLFGKLLEQFWPLYVTKLRGIQGDDAGARLAGDGKWKEAREFWDHGSNDYRADWKTFFNMALCFEREGLTAKALPFYRYAQLRAPYDQRIWDSCKQAEQACLASEELKPVEETGVSISHRILEIKENGILYINAGEDEAVAEGDRFTILRGRVEYDSEYRMPARSFYYKVGDVTVDKVFKGVFTAKLSSSAGGNLPVKGDAAVRESGR
jgi:tetratricopeptide (TPR) repeat protein